ncbi:MAG: hypothetical protein ACKOC5_00450 [Chloroflexota bacterium]
MGSITGKFSPVINMWDAIKEADLRPLREQALRGVRVALVGAPGSGRHALAGQMRRDPARPGQETDTPVRILDLDQTVQASPADLVILMMDSRQGDSTREQALVQEWNAAGKRVLVFINQPPAPALPAGAAPLAPQPVPPAAPAAQAAPAAPQSAAPAAGAEHPLPGGADPAPAAPGRPPGEAGPAAGEPASAAPSDPASSPASAGKPPAEKGRRRRGVVWGDVNDTLFLTEKFAPAVIELLPDHLLGLGRAFPLFRVPLARSLIADTSFSNAAYAFSTGLAETFAIADAPIVVADSLLLAKNQLFLVYKLGLAFGYSTRWQDYVAEFGGVLGSGFLLRQIARTLVGLIPVVGLLPKTGVAYAGTYAVGSAVLQWYLTGRHVSRQQMREFYLTALGQGRRVARLFVRPAPKALPEPPLTAPDGAPGRAAQPGSAASSGGRGWFAGRRLPALRWPFKKPAGLRLPLLRRRKPPA